MIRNQWNKRLSLDRTYSYLRGNNHNGLKHCNNSFTFQKKLKGQTTTLKDYKSLQQQNNSTNQILSTLSSQVDRIENKVETPQIVSQIVTPQFLDRNLDKNRSIFKPIEVGNKIVKFSNNDDLIKCLTKRIEQLDLVQKPSTSNTKS